MPGRNEVSFSDASATNSTRPNTTTSDSAIELAYGSESGSGARKRKRDAGTVDDLLRESFVVKPYPPKAPAKTRTLQPLLLLSRSQLPLSYLDVFSSSNPLPQSRLFETHVRILELEGRMGNEPMLVIARLDDGRTLYAVEREDRGLYAIFKLGSWVNLQQLRATAAVSRQGSEESLEKKFELGFAVPNPTGLPSVCSKKKRLAIESIQLMVKRPTTGILPDSQPAMGVGEKPSQDKQPMNASQSESITQTLLPESTAPPNASEIFDNIRNQYFDALYLSKASLAYFAKGPLSRARAAFHLDYDSTLEMTDLIAFLETLVLSTAVIDKKYKDGLPNTISMVDVEDHSANDASKAKSKKKKAAKKLRPGKNGLFPMEDHAIRKWWSNHEEDFEIGVPGRTRDDVTKSRLAHLRVRETQLQMILILEIMALRPLASSVDDFGDGLPGASKSVSDDKSSKTKKSGILLTLMEVHIDRLCIWQSISSETTKSVTDDSQASVNTVKHSENITRDFCVDIIAPFFSSRLPDQCAVINRKLGGPVNISPPKAKISRSMSAAGRLSRPGAATKRPVPAKPQQSLSRILTDERERERRSVSAQPNRKLSLMRAATMPLMPGIKREGSEAPSLSGIPAAESQPTFVTNKTGFSNTKRFGHREVDFSASSRDVATKAEKQAKINDELKVAIAALKKPNRELAGKTFAESVEKRVVSSSHPRKSRKPIRNPLFQDVQISATPKANRQTDVFSASQVFEFSRLGQSEFDFVPPSSVPSSKVPQSSISSQEKSGPRNPFLSMIQATPTRKPTLASQQAQIKYDPSPQSPIHVRRSSASLFALVPDSAIKASNVRPAYGSADLSALQETPVKKTGTYSNIHCHPMLNASGSDKENGPESEAEISRKGESVEKGEEANIYKTLGWDDDVDDLLA